MKYLIALLICCFHTSQAGFVRRGFGARGTGLASSYLPVADDIWAIRGNPGALIQIHQSEIGTDFSPDPFGLSELHRSAAALAIPTTIASIGFSIESFGFNLYREFTASIACAKNIGGIGIGVTLNSNSVVIENYGSSQAFSFDAGVLIPLTPPVSIGLVMINFAGSTIGESRERIPQSFALGISDAPIDRIRLYASYGKELGSDASFACGFEYRAVDEITLRGGMAGNPALASGGIGLRIFGVCVEYAFSHHDDLDWTHEFSIILMWGGEHE